MKPQHLDWLTREKVVTTSEGKQVIVYELTIHDDENTLNSWAKHLREHYCSDSDIDVLCIGFKRDEYLRNIKFPDEHTKIGASVRSADFSEILVADYVQYVLDYVVPRTRYDRKVNRDSSTMGSDLIGYKCGNKSSNDDEIILFEVKATASEVSPGPVARLQAAINDSNKDVLRLAETLNAVVQRLIDRRDFQRANQVQRFQNSSDNPYIRTFAAAAVHSNRSYSEAALKTVSTVCHTNPDLNLIVIHCDRLMDFIHMMYRKACNC